MTSAPSRPARHAPGREGGRGSVAVHRWLRAVRQDRLASDPGLLRLRLAARATLAVALSSLVLHRVGPALGFPAVVAMLIGGMISMNGSFASSSRGARDTVRTLAGMPVAAAAGAAPAAVLAGHTALHLVGFVVVMVLAVLVRRWGARWFSYGMLAWLSYFFATFVGVTPHRLPALVAVVVVATACLVLVAALLLPDRPPRTRALAHRSFSARVGALAATAHDVVAGELDAEHAARRLHAGGYRLLEAALILDGSLATADSHAAAVSRRSLMEAELAGEELAGAVQRLPGDLPGDVRRALLDALGALAADRPAEARAGARAAQDRVERAGGRGDPVWLALAAVVRLARVLDGPAPEVPAHADDYQPAVELYLGNLPGTAPSVNAVLEHSRLPWSLNTRLCVQTAVAAPIALVLGELLSPQRYYWAVLACFLVLTGTLTTGEATTKGVNRVLGTLGGLLAATVAVHVTGARPAPVVAVMLVCVFLGLYFFRVSYALMAFAVTTLMGELYNVLHELDEPLLLLRLAETAVGAAVAVAVVLVVLPVRSSEVREAAEQALMAQLGALLAALRDRLARAERSADLLYEARLVDAKLHQLALVTRPAAGPMLVGLASRSGRAVLAPWTALAYRARSLATTVTGVEPGAYPDLAERCDLLRRICQGLDQPWPGSTSGSTPVADDAAHVELARRLDGLARAVEAVRVLLPAGRAG